MSSWDELTAIAILGTNQRKRAGAPVIDGKLGALVTNLHAAGSRSVESLILDESGIIALHRQAGQLLPTAKNPMPHPAEPDTGATCIELAASHLSLLIDEYRDTLLRQWLDGACRSRLYVTPLLIPTLLELGKKEKALRPEITQVVGNRGRWLAQFNADWQYAALATIDSADEEGLKSLYETGSPQERSAAVEALRSERPDLARQLVQSSWEQEEPKQKAEFLLQFWSGLSMDDEPFLEEQVLKDKRKEVRVEAVRLLATLRESRLQERMLNRVTPLLKVEKKNNNPRLDLFWPQDCDKSMITDGMSKPGTVGAEQKGQWLEYMVGLIPPDTWSQRFALTPAAILDLLSGTDMHVGILVRAFERATILHNDAVWAEAIIASGKSTQPVEVFQVLALEQQEDLLTRAIAHNGGKLEDKDSRTFLTLALLGSTRHEWSEKFAGIVLAAALRSIPSNNQQFKWQIAPVIKTMAVHLPISILPHALTAFPLEQEAWLQLRRDADQFLTDAQFKLDLFSAQKCAAAGSQSSDPSTAPGSKS